MFSCKGTVMYDDEQPANDLNEEPAIDLNKTIRPSANKVNRQLKYTYIEKCHCCHSRKKPLDEFQDIYSML